MILFVRVSKQTVDVFTKIYIKKCGITSWFYSDCHKYGLISIYNVPPISGYVDGFAKQKSSEAIKIRNINIHKLHIWMVLDREIV